jgi:hypothetical protein
MKSFRRVFLFPLIVFGLGCIPGLNALLYSGHGGIFWLILPLCFPYIVILLGFEVRRLASPDRKRGLKMAVIATLLYVGFAYSVANWTQQSVTSQLGLQIPDGTLFKLATFPVGFLFPPYHYSWLILKGNLGTTERNLNFSSSATQRPTLAPCTLLAFTCVRMLSIN